MGLRNGVFRTSPQGKRDGFPWGSATKRALENLRHETLRTIKVSERGFSRENPDGKQCTFLGPKAESLRKRNCPNLTEEEKKKVLIKDSI